MKCIPITCKTACNHVNGRFPYHWDLNVYRGCAHDCKYCFARYSHGYLGEQDFSGKVFVKTNVAEALERQMHSPKWDHAVINLGGVTDSYQPCEAQEKRMPDILRLMIKYKNPIILSTKSDLILRDFDLIEELSSLVYVNIVATVTVMEEDVREKLEPGAVSSARRMEMLKVFGKTKAHTAVHTMPLIPYLTDTAENLEAVFFAGKEAGVDYLLTAFLNLRGETRNVFLDFMKKEYPMEYHKLLPLYLQGGLKEYRPTILERVHRMQKKYGLYADYQRMIDREMQKKQEPQQLSLFDPEF